MLCTPLQYKNVLEDLAPPAEVLPMQTITAELGEYESEALLPSLIYDASQALTATT
jgi:hypothetical protein